MSAVLMNKLNWGKTDRQTPNLHYLHHSYVLTHMCSIWFWFCSSGKTPVIKRLSPPPQAIDVSTSPSQLLHQHVCALTRTNINTIIIRNNFILLNIQQEYIIWGEWLCLKLLYWLRLRWRRWDTNVPVYQGEQRTTHSCITYNIIIPAVIAHLYRCR